MKKFIMLASVLLVWITTSLPAQTTREQADAIVQKYLPNDVIQHGLLYVNVNTPGEGDIVITTSNEEIIKLQYACWAYYLNESESDRKRYFFVKENNGNLLEVVAYNDLGPKDLSLWKMVSPDTHDPLEQTITQGKIWHIESGGSCLEADETFCFCYAGLQTIKTGNIRIFNGKEYYELLTDSPPNNHHQGNVITYVREEGKRVFFYAESCDKEYLMYDFNLNVGDEISLVDPLYPMSIVDYENPCELTEEDMYLYQFKVTEVDSIEYNHVKRKRLRLENHYPYRYDSWVEGIGCMRGITYHRAQQITGVKQLKDCYESDELIFVNENPEYCWASTTIVNTILQNLINIFTDEKNMLHIVNAKDIPLFIYDVQGRRIQSIFPANDNYEINMSFLLKGVYIVSNEIKNINFKIVIK